MELLAPAWVTPPFDESVKYQVIGLSGLAHYEFRTLGEVKYNDDGTAEIPIEGVRFLLKNGLLDWAGVKKAGQVIEFDRAEANKGLDTKTIVWLCGQVLDRTTGDGNLEKN